MITPVRDLIERLALDPHPEGGWYREFYRSPERVQTPRGPRAALTAIYYLLESGQWSRWHTLLADEVWHFYQGDPLDQLTYAPASRELAHRELSGRDDGPRTAVVPAGVWQAARPLGAYALVGCTVGPGFAFEDFRLVASLPEHTGHLDGPFGAAANLLQRGARTTERSPACGSSMRSSS